METVAGGGVLDAGIDIHGDVPSATRQVLRERQMEVVEGARRQHVERAQRAVAGDPPRVLQDPLEPGHHLSPSGSVLHGGPLELILDGFAHVGPTERPDQLARNAVPQRQAGGRIMRNARPSPKTEVASASWIGKVDYSILARGVPRRRRFTSSWTREAGAGSQLCARLALRAFVDRLTAPPALARQVR